MGTTLTYQKDSAGIAPLEERIGLVRDRVATLVALAAASAGMALAEPRIRAFWSVCAVFALVEISGDVPASTAARLRLFLHSPSTPLLARPGDDERFCAWLRPIEHELAESDGG